MARFLLLLILSLEAFYGASACSCINVPFEETFCSSDFVIKAQVNEIGMLLRKNVIFYFVNVLETYRATPDAQAYLKNKMLTSSGDVGMCGVKLKLNQVVVVGGHMVNGAAKIGACDLRFENMEDIKALENYRINFPRSCPSSASQNDSEFSRNFNFF